MNIYRITYIVGEGESKEAYITERTEAAARKTFKRMIEGREIADVELYETDAPATKEQEREALEKIKAMVAELGPDSYLKAAFTGVFEVAELNIQDDAAYSLKARLEDTEKRLQEMGSVYNAAKMDAVHLQEQLTAAQEQIAVLTKRQLSPWLHGSIYSLVTEELTTARQRMEQCAEIMAHFADAPQDIAFADAVKGYRAAKERREACEQIVAALEQLTEE